MQDTIDLLRGDKLMSKSLVLGILVLIVCLMSGCASIVSGTSQEVTFQSAPEGATVTVGGKVIGKTPITTTIKKKNDQALTFEKEGYKTQTMQLATRLDSWFWGNIVLGGVIGSTTDGLSGAVHEYSPNQYFITLPPNENNPVTPQTTQKIKAKEFIVLAYKNILADLAKGSGEYADSLMTTLAVPQADQKDAANKIKSLSEVYTDIPTFADRVIGLYIK